MQPLPISLKKIDDLWAVFDKAGRGYITVYEFGTFKPDWVSASIQTDFYVDQQKSVYKLLPMQTDATPEIHSHISDELRQANRLRWTPPITAVLKAPKPQPVEAKADE